ncbi:PAS domain-containing sensor histidine kinase [Cyclobacterium plantarum]|uniref:histidine kinase n=1 Tax=Cyclobacterium plantarum TaxID=2716263 RepID=A0ABX0HFI3_9BACT|nr:PAS domain-containing sensor histidine kinase [Cyclobacterium plantarum]NHE59141.1 PAS domain S-box protein [Cyclobacterium plantarum]
MVNQKEGDRHWSKVLKLTGVGAWEIDPANQSFSCCAIGREILQISQVAPVSISFLKGKFKPDFSTMLTHALGNFLNAGQAFLEVLELLSGSRVIVRARLVQDGDAMRYCGSIESLDVPGLTQQPELFSDRGDLYKILFQDNPMPMFTWEFGSLNIIDVNRQALLKYGYSREEFLSLNIRDIRPVEDIPLIEKHTKGGDIYGTIHQKVWRHLNKAGELMLVEITGHLVEIAGRSCSMVLINDITNRVEAEEQLLESLKDLSDYRFALDESCLVMILDRERKVEYVNLKFQEISGFDKSGLDQHSLRVLYDESDEQLIQDCWDATYSGRIWRGELKGKTKDGGVFWVDTIMIPFKDNQDIAYQYIWVGYDITEKKLVDEALIKERSLLRAIIDNLPIQIYVKDTDGRHIINNRFQYENLLGSTSEEETLGKTVYDYFPEEIATGMDAYDRQILRDGEPILNVEEYYHDRNGRQVWLLTNKVPLKDSYGKVVGLVGMSRDVTDTKKKEENLKSLNVALQDKALELERSNQELEQFAYIASHDLQEPLRMITGFMGLLEKKYQTLLDEKGKQYIHFAVDGASRMKNIIMDLLTYSRAGRIEEKVKEVAIDELVSNILQLHKELIQQKNARISLGKLPRLIIPVAPIRQVFQNLINNALKYQNEGHIPEVDIQAEENEDYWMFSVKDNGIGIPEGLHDQVFILFSRLHEKQKFTGSGIGLAMCKKIIENLGGTIGFSSVEGKGSTFFFTFPKTISENRLTGLTKDFEN